MRLSIIEVVGGRRGGACYLAKAGSDHHRLSLEYAALTRLKMRTILMEAATMVMIAVSTTIRTRRIIRRFVRLVHNSCYSHVLEAVFATAHSNLTGVMVNCGKRSDRSGTSEAEEGRT